MHFRNSLYVTTCSSDTLKYSNCSQQFISFSVTFSNTPSLLSLPSSGPKASFLRVSEYCSRAVDKLNQLRQLLIFYFNHLLFMAVNWFHYCSGLIWHFTHFVIMKILSCFSTAEVTLMKKNTYCIRRLNLKELSLCIEWIHTLVS